MPDSSQGRIYWIDALKAMVVIGIALFHAALVFAPGSWIVNNPQRSIVLGAFAGFTFQWGIALLFLLAGSASWFALRSRGAVAFLRMRIVRLGLPLAAGLAVLSPLQSYFGHARSPDLAGLLQTYGTFWTSVHPSWSPSSAYDYVYHLWFLTHLLLISALTLPVAAWLRSPSGRRWIAAAVPWIRSPAGFLLAATPPAVAQMALHARFPLYQDWSDIAVWSVLYLEGFVVVSEPQIQLAVRRWLRPALLSALLLLGVIELAYAAGLPGWWDSRPDYSPGYLVYQAVRALSMWSWVVVFLAFGVRRLDFESALTRWGADRPLPFYVLSHPIIVVVASYVVAWPLGVWAKFGVIATFSIGVSLALCEVVSRHGALRILFGLGAKQKPGSRPPAPQAAVMTR